MTTPHTPLTAAHRSSVVAAALAILLTAACADGALTAPPSAATATGPSAERGQATWLIETVDVPGALLTSAQGINASGDIVGFYVDAAKHVHGFLWQDGAFTTIDYTDPATGVMADNTDARGIGPGGDIVGTHWNTGEEAVAAHGYLRAADGSFTPVHYLGHLNEIPQRILADGMILGCRHDHDTMASMRGITIRGTDTTEMTNLFGSMANGATPDGHLIVGLYNNMMVTPTRTEGFVIAGADTTAFLVPGSNFTTAWDVNPRGDIVGVYRDEITNVVHGYMRTGNGRTLDDAEYSTIDGPNASATRAFGVNARGDVVGAYVVGTGKSAVTHGFHATRMR